MRTMFHKTYHLIESTDSFRDTQANEDCSCSKLRNQTAGLVRPVSTGEGSGAGWTLGGASTFTERREQQIWRDNTEQEAEFRCRVSRPRVS